MPIKEYRILVNGKIADISYTRNGHKLAVSYYANNGIPFTIEVVNLV
jgi:hypothetical protein